MATWNLWTTLFGMKTGSQVAQIATPILQSVAPQAASMIDTINTVAGAIGSTTTVTTVAATLISLDAAGVQKFEAGLLNGVNSILVSKGVDPVSETEIDNAIIAAVAGIENAAAAPEAAATPSASFPVVTQTSVGIQAVAS